MSNSLKNHLYTVISGKSEVRYGKAIQAFANHLRESQRTSKTPEVSKLYKVQEKQELEVNLFYNRINKMKLTEFIDASLQVSFFNFALYYVFGITIFSLLLSI
jgi:hypothetical protein